MTSAARRFQTIADDVVLGEGATVHEFVNLYGCTIGAHRTRHAQATSDVLAHVMAHEVGHLILLAGGHSETGIMRDAWDPKELRTPVFSPEQAALIRTKLLHYRWQTGQ